MANILRTAPAEATVGELRQQCKDQRTLQGPTWEQAVFEREAINNPYAIIAHRSNYVLPLSYSKADETPYEETLNGKSLDDIEVKFQVSLKYVAIEDLFVDDLDLELAFTATSWWQAYNSAISSPFRETNYEPELIFTYKKPWSLFGLPVTESFVSFTHQSNGQAGELSRSWNRVIAGFEVTSGDLKWGARSWWRIPEDEKEYQGDPDGDDNPNMYQYMGYGEFNASWQAMPGHNIDVILRNNFKSDNKGAIRLGWTFPLAKHLRGYVEYFNGYGEGLIYYNEHTERIGLGVKLTDWAD